jgi:hypothetical protein
MRFGLGPPPKGAAQHRSSHYVYDVRSGAIVATYHFVGAAQPSGEELDRKLSKQTHETSLVPLGHLAVLTENEIPLGEGPIRVDLSVKRLIRDERFPVRIKA